MLQTIVEELVKGVFFGLGWAIGEIIVPPLFNFIGSLWNKLRGK